ncbi:unnamed protein product [Periconia digitata]|uniref:Uncharacterized protein n=1 Tax=Periconia digitata TaxID=1303443 RepID=A0A9W4UM03_9PLEO|nr:unnamed protein product [Periconia digitata]
MTLPRCRSFIRLIHIIVIIKTLVTRSITYRHISPVPSQHTPLMFNIQHPTKVKHLLILDSLLFPQTRTPSHPRTLYPEPENLQRKTSLTTPHPPSAPLQRPSPQSQPPPPTTAPAPAAAPLADRRQDRDPARTPALTTLGTAALVYRPWCCCCRTSRCAAFLFNSYHTSFCILSFSVCGV